MPREAVSEAVRTRGARRIGVMGTDGTVRSGIYARACEEAGVECVVPSPARQEDVMSIIYENVKAGHPADMRKFSLVVDELVRRGCDAIILACTELSVARRRQGAPEVCLDAMDVLVREAIVRSGKPYRP